MAPRIAGRGPAMQGTAVPRGFLASARFGARSIFVYFRHGKAAPAWDGPSDLPRPSGPYRPVVLRPALRIGFFLPAALRLVAVLARAGFAAVFFRVPAIVMVLSPRAVLPKGRANATG
jgi:hypothetical protein